MKADWLIPSDWAAGLSALDQIRATAKKADSPTQVLIGFVVPFSFGAILVWGCVYKNRLPPEEFVSGILGITAGLAAIIAGFVATMMLSLSSYRFPITLTFEQHQEFVEKLKYMLFSQTATLLSAMLSLLFAAAAILFVNSSLSFADPRLLTIAAGGFFSVTIVRFALLPLQIFELNEAYFDDTVDAKSEEVRRRIEHGSERG